MTLSALDLFTIGIGPSSSHTVGPMRAASRFMRLLRERGFTSQVARVRCDLYGSLAATGKGHGTDSAILLGFLGQEPETIEIENIPGLLQAIRKGSLKTPWGTELEFSEKNDLDFKRLKPLPVHPNGMHFTALNADGEILVDEVIYSLGGGFIATEEEIKHPISPEVKVPYHFTNAAELMDHCKQSGRSISSLLLMNESAFRPEIETRSRLDSIWEAMQNCVKRGCSLEGTLPGGLKVKRRARAIYQTLRDNP
jgi:L-serine dehydratase